MLTRAVVNERRRHTKLEQAENSDPEAFEPDATGHSILPEQINGDTEETSVPDEVRQPKVTHVGIMNKTPNAPTKMRYAEI